MNGAAAVAAAGGAAIAPDSLATLKTVSAPFHDAAKQRTHAMPNPRRIGSLALAAAVALAACASYTPVVDTRRPGFDEARYQQDLWECQRYAAEIDQVRGTMEGAVLGAVIAAAFGAIVGSFGGNVGQGAAIGASVGGLGGGLGGFGEAEAQQNQIVRNCLAGRGYAVLN